jgi:hypothetical protein
MRKRGRVRSGRGRWRARDSTDPPSPAPAGKRREERERVIRPPQERWRRSHKAAALWRQGCTGAETPKSREAGRSPQVRERERENERPTARSSRSRDASKSDLLPEVFPQRRLERGRPSQAVTKLRRDVVIAARGRASVRRLEWPPRPEISVPEWTVKSDREGEEEEGAVQTERGRHDLR